MVASRVARPAPAVGDAQRDGPGDREGGEAGAVREEVGKVELGRKGGLDTDRRCRDRVQQVPPRRSLAVLSSDLWQPFKALCTCNSRVLDPA
jgi:hypothetical protein